MTPKQRSAFMNRRPRKIRLRATSRWVWEADSTWWEWIEARTRAYYAMHPSENLTLRLDRNCLKIFI